MKYAVIIMFVLSLVFANVPMVAAETVEGVELGKVYEVTVTEQIDTPYTGPLGISIIGNNVYVRIKKAKKGEKYKVKIVDVEENPYTSTMDADFDIVSGP